MCGDIGLTSANVHLGFGAIGDACFGSEPPTTRKGVGCTHFKIKFLFKIIKFKMLFFKKIKSY